VGASRRRPT